MSDSRPHVIIVDDEEDFCELMALRLEHHGFRVTLRHTVQGGLEVLEREHVHAMVLDVRLENEDGLDLFSEVKRRRLEIPVIILPADGAGGEVQPDLGATDALMPKPFDTQELVRWLTNAVRRPRQSADAPAGGGP